jgi:hypothetical protein
MKTTTQNQIKDYLQLSEKEYEQMVLNHYWSWCHKYSTNEQMFQCYFSNSSINNYFMKEWEKNEKEFLAMVDSIPQRLERLSFHYNGSIVQVYKNWPAALLEKFKPAKKNEEPYMVRLNQFIFYAN